MYTRQRLPVTEVVQLAVMTQKNSFPVDLTKQKTHTLSRRMNRVAKAWDSSDDEHPGLALVRIQVGEATGLADETGRGLVAGADRV
jgi:hypothetical protein